MTADEKVNYLLAVIRGKGKGKSKGEAKGKQEGKGNKGGDGVQCYRCGKMGQKAPDCWTNLFQQSKGKENLGKGKDKGKATKGKDYSATTQQYHPTYASSSSSSGQFRGYCLCCGKWCHRADERRQQVWTLDAEQQDEHDWTREDLNQQLRYQQQSNQETSEQEVVVLDLSLSELVEDPEGCLAYL